MEGRRALEQMNVRKGKFNSEVTEAPTHDIQKAQEYAACPHTIQYGAVDMLKTFKRSIECYGVLPVSGARDVIGVAGVLVENLRRISSTNEYSLPSEYPLLSILSPSLLAFADALRMS